MKRKTRIILIIAIPPVAVITVLIAVYCGISLSASRSDMILLSDLSFLNAVIRTELSSYYKREGCYPENLDVLKETIIKNCYTTSVPEKPKELKLLNHFKYSSDGFTYTIIWSYKRKIDGTVWTYKEYGRNGKINKYRGRLPIKIWYQTPKNRTFFVQKRSH
ncbi:MAG: hypothetical protein GY845_10105 [Planctomycetes bacterium]|nr:hypothetical protein [Planctomycetota bacterium]